MRDGAPTRERARRARLLGEALEGRVHHVPGAVLSRPSRASRRARRRYAAVVFCDVSLSDEYFGIRACPRRRRSWCPTLHDEPLAYLRVFAALSRAHRAVPLADRSRSSASAARLWDVEEGEVIGMAVEHTDRRSPRQCRIRTFSTAAASRQAKAPRAARWFALFRAARRGSSDPLVLTGMDTSGLRTMSNMEFLGFVSEERKLALMAGALAFVQPSRYESFSIVALEAMAQGTPIVVNGHCAALAEHVLASGCGSAYRDRGEFDAAIDALVAMPASVRDESAQRARAYVANRYTREQVRKRLADEIAAVIAAQ